MSFGEALRDMDADLIVRASVGINEKGVDREGVQSILDDAGPNIQLMSLLASQGVLPAAASEAFAELLRGDVDREAVEAEIDSQPLAYALGVNAAINNLTGLILEYVSLEAMQKHFPTPPA